MPKAFVLNNSFVANEGVFQIIEKSFNSDNNLVIKGIATTNRIDKEGESLTITPQALKNGWQVFLSKGAPMLVEHGRTSHFESDKVGYYVSIDIPEDYNPLESDIPNKVQITVIGVVTDPEAIRLCLSGYLNSFSVDLSLPSPNSVWEKDKGTFKLITSVIINEITICNEPINPDCNFTIVTDQKLIEQYGFSNHIGDKVKAFDANAVVKSLYIDE
jgi:hypothetical protein